MSLSHCMNQATRIARLPRAEWAKEIESIPDACAEKDCGHPKNCRARIREYLRMQWRIQNNLRKAA